MGTKGRKEGGRRLGSNGTSPMSITMLWKFEIAAQKWVLISVRHVVVGVVRRAVHVANLGHGRFSSTRVRSSKPGMPKTLRLGLRTGVSWIWWPGFATASSKSARLGVRYARAQLREPWSIARNGEAAECASTRSISRIHDTRRLRLCMLRY